MVCLGGALGYPRTPLATTVNLLTITVNLFTVELVDKIDLDSLLGLDAEARGARLVSASESQWFERKAFRINAKKLAAAVIGMANAEGGLVAVGLSQGRVEGVDADPRQVNRLRRAPLELIDPPLLLRIEEIDVVNDEGPPTMCSCSPWRPASTRISALMARPSSARATRRSP